jgi:hypothetical protein
MEATSAVLASLFAVLITLALLALVVALPIWVLIEVIKSSLEVNTKILWVLVVFLFGPLGAVAYLLAGRPKPAKK